MLARLALLATAALLFACGEATDSGSVDLDKPSAVAHAYWNALYAGDYQRAQELSLKRDWPEQVDTAGPQNIRVDVAEAREENGETLVETHQQPQDPEEEAFAVTFDTVMAKEDGQWKVDAVLTTANFSRATLLTMKEQMRAKLDTLRDEDPQSAAMAEMMMLEFEQQVDQQLLELEAAVEETRQARE